MQDMLKTQWGKMRGPVRKTWNQLSDDDLKQVEGDRYALVGKLQEKYGYTKARANEEVEMFIKAQS